MSNETVLLLWQFVSAVATPRIIEKLKSVKAFPFANFQSSSLNRVFSWTVAAITGLGLGFHFDSALGQFTITGLTAAGIIAGLTHMAVQISANHATYKLLVAPPLSGLQQAINRDAGTPNALPSASLAPASPVGRAYPNSTHIFTVLPGDLTPVGETIEVAGVKYRKLSANMFEMQ